MPGCGMQPGQKRHPRAISDHIESKIQYDRMKLLAKYKLERFRLIGKRSRGGTYIFRLRTQLNPPPEKQGKGDGGVKIPG